MAWNVQVQMEKLGNDNCDKWRFHMEAVLVKNDHQEYLDGTTDRPEKEAAVTVWDRRDGKANADIILAISPTELGHIKN